MRSLVLGLAVMLALGGATACAQTFSGVFDVGITIDPAAAGIPAFLDFATNLTVTYEVGGWAFTSFTQLDDTGWIEQTFSVGGILGVFVFGTHLDFDPAGAFERWEVTVGLTFGGVAIDSEFTLADQDVTFIIGGSGTTGIVEIDIEVTLGGDDNDVCDLIWAGLDVTLEFPFCCADVTAVVAFDCDGFESVTLDVAGISIPTLPWLTIGAELTFRMETKSLVVSPAFDFDDDYCIDIYVSVDHNGNLDIGDIHIDGIKLGCAFGRVTFTGISYWGATGKPGELGDYWEMYKIESDDEACCGPLSFEAAVFFDATSSNLADVAMFTAEAEIEFGEPFAFRIGLESDVVAGTVELGFGFTITW
jgi:hypothetical protein